MLVSLSSLFNRIILRSTEFNRKTLDRSRSSRPRPQSSVLALALVISLRTISRSSPRPRPPSSLFAWAISLRTILSSFFFVGVHLYACIIIVPSQSYHLAFAATEFNRKTLHRSLWRTIHTDRYVCHLETWKTLVVARRNLLLWADHIYYRPPSDCAALPQFFPREPLGSRRLHAAWSQVDASIELFHFAWKPMEIIERKSRIKFDSRLTVNLIFGAAGAPSAPLVTAFLDSRSLISSFAFSISFIASTSSTAALSRPSKPLTWPFSKART
jgi:hypothetical protein